MGAALGFGMRGDPGYDVVLRDVRSTRDGIVERELGGIARSGQAKHSWFDKLTTNGFDKLTANGYARLSRHQPQ